MGDEAQILLVEDNPSDVRLVEEAFRDGQIHNQLHTVTDGQAALDFVHRDNEHADAPRPDIILLDLKLPKVDGEDVLYEIKHHPELGLVPVIVLSGMGEDFVESKNLDDDADTDAVLEKPIDPGEFIQLVREFDAFRLSILVLSSDGPRTDTVSKTRRERTQWWRNCRLLRADEFTSVLR